MTTQAKFGYHPASTEFSSIECSDSHIGPLTEYDEIVGATTVLPHQSGTTFMLDSTAPSYDIALPPVQAGLFYNFVITTDGANTITLRATDAHIHGKLSHATSEIACVDVTTIAIDTASAFNSGTYVTFRGVNSTQWFVAGNATSFGALIAA